MIFDRTYETNGTYEVHFLLLKGVLIQYSLQGHEVKAFAVLFREVFIGVFVVGYGH